MHGLLLTLLFTIRAINWINDLKRFALLVALILDAKVQVSNVSARFVAKQVFAAKCKQSASKVLQLASLARLRDPWTYRPFCCWKLGNLVTNLRPTPNCRNARSWSVAFPRRRLSSICRAKQYLSPEGSIRSTTPKSWLLALPLPEKREIINKPM